MKPFDPTSTPSQATRLRLSALDNIFNFLAGAFLRFLAVHILRSVEVTEALAEIIHQLVVALREAFTHLTGTTCDDWAWEVSPLRDSL